MKNKSDFFPKDEGDCNRVKTIVYIIDSLGVGGAEILLLGTLDDVARQYRIIVITLSDINEFDKTITDNYTQYSLGYTGTRFSFIQCIFRLKSIFKATKPDIIHAHLLNSSLIARLANFNHTPLVYSLHSILSVNAFNGSWWYRNLEKMLFNRRNYIIAVSREVLIDYESSVGKSSNSFILKNYISDNFLSANTNYDWRTGNEKLRLVAVGNIKKVKNYEYLIRAFSIMDNDRLSLDIYGKGEDIYVSSLKKMIAGLGVQIQLKGATSSVQEVLKDYDIYVMSSHNEGFGLAAIEAMGLGLPLLLSDVPVLREVTFGNALFFNPNDPGSFIECVESLLAGDYNLKELSENGKLIVETNYTKKQYIASLSKIYEEMLGG